MRRLRHLKAETTANAIQAIQGLRFEPASDGTPGAAAVRKAVQIGQDTIVLTQEPLVCRLVESLRAWNELASQVADLLTPVIFGRPWRLNAAARSPRRCRG